MENKKARRYKKEEVARVLFAAPVRG